jgi:hypothetical protein
VAGVEIAHAQTAAQALERLRGRIAAQRSCSMLQWC